MEPLESHRPNPIVGSWKLVSFTIKKGNGEVTYPFGEDARGSIIYTDSGRFSAQLMRSGRPLFASGDQMKGTSEEMEANFKGCISYYGAYDLNEECGFVVHKVESSLFPNWEGKSLKRYFEFSGDRLNLTTPPTLWGGRGEAVVVIVWERIN